MKENRKISVAVSGSPSWPRYSIVNANRHYWNNEKKEWMDDSSEASTFANLYTLKHVVSEIEETAHEHKSARYYQGTFVVKIRCDDDYSEEELQYHLAKCVTIRVTSGQPEEGAEIQDAWVSVVLPWSTIEEMDEKDYKQY